MTINVLHGVWTNRDSLARRSSSGFESGTGSIVPKNLSSSVSRLGAKDELVSVYFFIRPRCTVVAAGSLSFEI